MSSPPKAIDREPARAALHDMRSATLAIDAIISLIRRRGDTESERMTRELDLMRRSVRRIDQLVALLHPLIGDDAERLEVDVAVLLGEELERVRSEATARDVGLALAPAGAPLAVGIDPIIARAAIRGLLSAAVRASRPGAVVGISLSRRDDSFSVEIAGLDYEPGGVESELCSALIERLGGRRRWCSESATVVLELPRGSDR